MRYMYICGIICTYGVYVRIYLKVKGRTQGYRSEYYVSKVGIQRECGGSCGGTMSVSLCDSDWGPETLHKQKGKALVTQCINAQRRGVGV